MANSTLLPSPCLLPRPRRGAGFSAAGLLLAGLLLLLLLLSARPGQAQDVSTYQLAASSGTFVPFTAGITINNLSQDGAISANIPLPFTFYYGGKAITTVQATSDGYLDLTGSGTVSFPNNGFGAHTLIAPLWDDLTGAGGQASWLVTGTAPNRVFTFQWLNWRWTYNAAAANISFQAKLYETTNVIQFVYRPEAGTVSSNAGATIGLDGGTIYAGDAINSHKNYASLSDASASPTLVSTFGSVYSQDNITTRPAAGQTYTFTPINDYCAHATPLAYGSTTTGSTTDASQQDDPRGTCAVGGAATPSASPGVFYSLVGNGQTVTVSTCSGATAAGGDTRLFVYTGTCGSFTCVGSNDDVLAAGCGTNPLASAVTFATTTGTVYYVFVQFKQTGVAGPFGLRTSATGLATRAAFGPGSLEVFPNPAQRTFTLRLPALASERTAQVTLVNALGQVVQARRLDLGTAGTDAQVDVQALAPGLYTVRVQAGAQAAARQVVIE